MTFLDHLSKEDQRIWTAMMLRQAGKNGPVDLQKSVAWRMYRLETTSKKYYK